VDSRHLNYYLSVGLFSSREGQPSLPARLQSLTRLSILHIQKSFLPARIFGFFSFYYLYQIIKLLHYLRRPGYWKFKRMAHPLLYFLHAPFCLCRTEKAAGLYAFYATNQEENDNIRREIKRRKGIR
jgi:hypothetical protein